MHLVLKLKMIPRTFGCVCNEILDNPSHPTGDNNAILTSKRARIYFRAYSGFRLNCTGSRNSRLSYTSYVRAAHEL